jgi:hypothetical protein
MDVSTGAWLMAHGPWSAWQGPFCLSFLVLEPWGRGLLNHGPWLGPESSQSLQFISFFVPFVRMTLIVPEILN